MVLPAQFTDRIYLPAVPSGVNALFIGDSITARNVFGEWADAICTAYGLTRVGESEPLMPAKYETDILGVGALANCTASWDATRSYIGGTHALKITSAAAGAASASFPGGVATTGGNAGTGLNLGMTANVPQTLGGAIWHPTATGGAGAQFTLSDRIGAGTSTVTSSTSVTPSDSGWSVAAVIRTAPVGTDNMWARVAFNPTAAGQSIWVDATYLAHTNGDVRPAIGGASLATNAVGGNANSILDGWSSRVTAYPAKVAFLCAGTNDFFFQTASYTPALWGTAMRTAITQLKAISPLETIIVLGLPPAKATVPTGTLGPTGYATGQALRDAMDARTRAACADANVPFVPLWDMPLADTDGTHPDANTLGSVPAGGQTWMASRVADVLNRVVR